MISEFESTPNQAAVVQLSGHETLLRVAKADGTEVFIVQGQLSDKRPAWITLTANADGTFNIQGFLRIQVQVSAGTAVVGTVS